MRMNDLPSSGSFSNRNSLSHIIIYVRRDYCVIPPGNAYERFTQQRFFFKSEFPLSHYYIC